MLQELLQVVLQEVLQQLLQDLLQQDQDRQQLNRHPPRLWVPLHQLEGAGAVIAGPARQIEVRSEKKN